MRAELFDGKKVAGEILRDLKEKAPAKKLRMAVVQVAENAVSAKYIQEKEKVARELGVEFLLVKLAESVSQEDLQKAIKKLAQDRTVSGIVVQLPLPKHIRREDVLDEIPAGKDVDVLSAAAFNGFAAEKSIILPPTVAAVKALLDFYGISVRGKRVALVGRGRLVGLPLEVWFEQQHVDLRVATEETKHLAGVLKDADIVISGVGKAGLVTGEMIREGAVVIDAGTSVEYGITKGDVDFESVAAKASFVTPVPGGVGPITVACLLRNLLTLSS